VSPTKELRVANFSISIHKLSKAPGAKHFVAAVLEYFNTGDLRFQLF